MQSHGSPACLAMSVSSATLPFERVVTTKRRRRRSSGDGVRPGPQAMPSVIELHLFLLVHPLDPETDQQLVENQPVERVELAPWQMTPADLNGWLGHGPSVLP